jgi:hypothetical protein
MAMARQHVKEMNDDVDGSRLPSIFSKELRWKELQSYGDSAFYYSKGGLRRRECFNMCTVTVTPKYAALVLRDGPSGLLGMRASDGWLPIAWCNTALTPRCEP